MSWRALALPLLAGVALVGCGGEDEDPGGPVEAVAERFERIVAERDTQAFCDALAPSDVRRLGGGRTNGERECLAVWGPDRNPLFRAEEPDFSVERVSLKGDYAIAKLANGGELAFSHEGGEWYVHLAPGPGQGARR